MEELDDWGLSAEELNFLEEDAIKKISERKASSSSASVSVAPSTSSSSPLPSKASAASHMNPPSMSPEQPFSRNSSESRYQKVETFPPLGLSSTDASRETGKDTTSALSKLCVRLCLHASGVIAAKFNYHPLLVDAFHKIPKASWHGKERLWMFPPSSLAVAEEVLNVVTGVDVEVQTLDPLVRRALAAASSVPDLRASALNRSRSLGIASVSSYSVIETEQPLHRSPLFPSRAAFVALSPWQRCSQLHDHHCHLATPDASLLGSAAASVTTLNCTIVRPLLHPSYVLNAIAVAACIPDAWPVLVVTPSSLRLQWASMIQQWLNIPSADILVVLSQHGGSNKAGFKIVFSNLKSNIHLDGVFNIVSYDVVPKIQDILLASEFKIVIADESHFMKNAQAKRTNACLPVLQKAQYAILLSGTPALSRPIELFKQLEALYPGVYKNVHEYGNRYCKGGIFGLYQGASNHEELHSLMKATVMIRRLKKDVLSQLPVKRRQQVFLDLNEKDLKQIRIMFRELEVVKMNIQACDSPEKIESLKFMQKNLINKIYNDSAEAKIPAVLDYLSTVIEADCKFLIFAHHQPMIDAIHQFLLLSIKAGGVGLNLTAASTIFFAELTWTPGDIIQAEDRAHRIGQVPSALELLSPFYWCKDQKGRPALQETVGLSSHHSLLPSPSAVAAPTTQPSDPRCVLFAGTANSDEPHRRISFPLLLCCGLLGREGARRQGMALRRALGWSDGELMRSDAKPCTRLMRHTAGIFKVGGALAFWVRGGGSAGGCEREKRVETFPALGLSSTCASRETGKDTTSALSKLCVRLYLHASGVIAAKFDYHPLLIDAFRKIPKASWHGKERLWMFPPSSLKVAKKVLNAVAGVDVEVQKVHPLVRRALAAASAVPDLREDLYDRMPSYVESKLLPFQREGIRFMLQHGGRALLADDMGLGKTLQALDFRPRSFIELLISSLLILFKLDHLIYAIAVAACIPDAWPVLVVTPSSLRLHWASMIQQWLNIPSADILVVLSQHGGSNKAGFKIAFSNLKSNIHLDGVFNIVSYDVVPKIQDILLASEFKIVIADESHFMKNAQAKRTNGCLPVLQKAQYAILLSGTPALSRPIELFKQLEALYPGVYKNVHEYGNRYCKGGFFGLYQGASNHEELHSLMKATVMIRRLKKDVLSQLPVKRRQQVFLDLNEKDLKQIRIMFRELEVVKMNIQACDSPEKMESLKFTQKNLINKIYNDSAEVKIPAVLDYLSTVIEADCKFLIFAHHQPMIDAIHQFLLLSIKAGGVGLNLTAASTIFFAELTWTPGDIIQAEDRAHRIGQPFASGSSLVMEHPSEN
ncbi:SNF2 family N-terminal domain containing protein [Musa troglodytarum]|uniref:SNF2 family N-terminal domain containing protein n=1 Tax=Musa troglodytarum TaxID=320322 RepID=A0A9E7F6G5_9LILI|nr:SNF2 family N-terminal domain containing protein [Musa troglodytarum]